MSETVKRRGRPVLETSARQARLAARAARMTNGEVKRGRPANENSARQAKIAARIARMEAGEVVKRGRPKMAKTEVVVEA